MNLNLIGLGKSNLPVSSIDLYCLLCFCVFTNMKTKKNSKYRKYWVLSKPREVTIDVNCYRSTHKIKLTKKGRLVLLNHTKEDERIEKTLTLMGSTHRCGCMSLKKKWIKYTTRSSKSANYMAELPEELKVIAKEARIRNKLRHSRLANNNRPSTIDVLSSKPVTKRASFISKVIKKALESSELCKGPLSKSNKLKVFKVKITMLTMTCSDSAYVNLLVPILTWPIAIGTRHLFGRSGLDASLVKTIYIYDENWFHHYYKQNTATIHGCLIVSKSSTGYAPNKGPRNINEALKSKLFDVSTIRLGYRDDKLYCFRIHTKIRKTDDGKWVIDQ